MPPASPLYSSIQRTPPAALKAMDPGAVPGVKGLIKHMLTATQDLQQQKAGQVVSADSSIFNHPVTQSSPILGWMIGFGTLLGTTIYNWDELSQEERTAKIITLGGFTFSALQAGFVYWRYQRQMSLVDERTAQHTRLSVLLSSLQFLKKSAKMAEICLAGGDQLPVAFGLFEIYMTSLPAGVVENPLSLSWSTAKALIQAGQLEPLQTLMTTSIMPLVKHYAKDVRQELVRFGYEPPQAEVEVEIEN